jgi:putative acetyltransferase
MLKFKTLADHHFTIEYKFSKTGMKLNIRKFSDKDTPGLLGLFHDTVHTINSQDYSLEQINAWAPTDLDVKKWRARFKSSKTIVAEEEGKIVGFANLENNRSAIGMLYVHRDYQRQGIATLLLKRLERKLIKRRIENAMVESSITARPFFEQLGYGVVRENRKMTNGAEFQNFVMEKALTLNDNKGMKGKSKERKSFRWRDLLISKVFDLLIVIMGVSIAFQLNNLKLSADQKSLEKFYLESMVADLDKDIATYNRIIANIKSDHDLIGVYLESYRQHTQPVDSLGYVIVQTLGFETFAGNQDTYATLLSSNGYSTLSDRTVRSRITEYYKKYGTIARFEKVYTDFLYQLNNYFSPYCDFARAKIIDESIVDKVQTRNNLFIAKAQLSEALEDYGEIMANAQALRASLELSIQKKAN